MNNFELKTMHLNVKLGQFKKSLRVLGQATENVINSGRALTKLIGHEGLWYEQQDMWSKYLRRPMDTLGDMCFAQFAKIYSSCSQTNSNEEKLSKNGGRL